MKRTFLLLLFFMSILVSFAQVTKERRVYYLDCTYSMVDYGIWDPVRENLKKSINAISDETTELVLVPFTDASHSYPVSIEYATPTGKQNLCAKIDALIPEKKCYTEHSGPLNDFMTKRVRADKVTYMFFLTDGKTKRSDSPKMLNLLKTWGKNYGNKNVYGFYVVLNENAKNPMVSDVISHQKHLWEVETAEVNINMIRLETPIIYNIRSDKYVDISISGKTEGIDLNLSLRKNPYYKIRKIAKEQNKIRLSLTAMKELSFLPENQNLLIRVSPSSSLPDYNYLVTDEIAIKCINKKERSLKITFK